MNAAEKLMRDVVAAFVRADLRPLMDALDDQVIWKSAFHTAGPVRVQGDYLGRTGVMEVLSTIAARVHFLRMTPKDVVAADDVVMGAFEAEIRYGVQGHKRGTDNSTVTFDMAIRWRLKNGKIVEHQAFFDTAYLLSRLGALGA